MNFSQLLYSESAWANYDISKLLLENQDAVYQAQVLDTIQAVATSYLNLLRSKADEEIRLSNLEVTRRNLELAEIVSASVALVNRMFCVGAVSWPTTDAMCLPQRPRAAMQNWSWRGF